MTATAPKKEFDIKPEKITVWRPSDLAGIEIRRGTNVARPVPRHWHEEFQLCFVQAGAGELFYRGVNHLTPPASLFIVHPGEIHSNFAYGPQGCSYSTIYARPDLVSRAASEVSGRSQDIPFFSTSIIYDRDILDLYTRLHLSLEMPGASLERESRLLELLVKLITRYSEDRPQVRPHSREPEHVRRVREYLTEHYAENVSLEELSRIVGLSQFHLNRVFSREVGMPPHAFQTQVRIVEAKRLLRQGLSLSQVAAQTGFADQSHFTRHFKRLAVVPPGKYLEGSKNVQDFSRMPR
ncbi:MAG: AraC family transcriptional regulator [Blastocatellia bacterium]|nr:AraC family transcriptional regulator [Blastocatellia bacterium]